jgi:hypothetical protein
VCGWRGWGIDLGPKFGEVETALATRALARDPPNLNDTTPAGADHPPREIDLKALDTLGPVGERPE